VPSDGSLDAAGAELVGRPAPATTSAQATGVVSVADLLSTIEYGSPVRVLTVVATSVVDAPPVSGVS
jgi:hypothetical protein